MATNLPPRDPQRDSTTLADGSSADLLCRIPFHAALIRTPAGTRWVMSGWAGMTPGERREFEAQTFQP
ncbi:hypothetical protein [Ferrovibrio terrae]|uniref:hypothetical protein n=1 Tax=Ferrovibrio terrae TaxID=2594003 RepID=UPI003137D81C